MLAPNGAAVPELGGFGQLYDLKVRAQMVVAGVLICVPGRPVAEAWYASHKSPNCAHQ